MRIHGEFIKTQIPRNYPRDSGRAGLNKAFNKHPDVTVQSVRTALGDLITQWALLGAP